MKSGNTEILLHTAVKTEVKPIDQKPNTNSLFIGLKSETLKDDQKGFVLKNEPHTMYTGAETKPQDTGPDFKSETKKEGLQIKDISDNPIQGLHQNQYLWGDSKHRTVISSGIFPLVKLEGNTATVNKHPVDTKGMFIKSDSKAGVKVENPKPIPALNAMWYPPIVIKPEDQAFNAQNTARTGSLSTSVESQPSSATSRLCNDKVDVSIQPIHRDHRPYKCSLCDKAFTCNVHLFYHENTHNRGDKPYKYTVCGRVFSRQAYLTTHEQIHTGEKPYKCTECDDEFALKARLTRHLKTHAGEKPYNCYLCEKRFISKGDLYIHLQTHARDKHFIECTVCGKGFSRHSDLATHERIHTGEIPCKWGECEKWFKSESDLKDHLLEHTGERPYKCRWCGRGYSRYGRLRSHEHIHETDPLLQATRAFFAEWDAARDAAREAARAMNSPTIDRSIASALSVAKNEAPEID